MRRSRIALGVLGAVIGGAVALLALRGRESAPSADPTPAADSGPVAPPPLAAPPLAPSPRRGPDAGEPTRVDPAPATGAPKPGIARVEGTVVSAETGVPIALLKFHLAFRKGYGATPRTLDVETDRFGAFAGELEIAEAELASKRNPSFPMIRIVTSWGEGANSGTNTQYFGLGPDAVEHLKRVRDRLARPR